MIDVDQELGRAGEETRRFAATRPVAVAPQTWSAAPNRGWLVFAASFVVMIALFGLLPWMMQTTQTTQPAPLGDDTPLTAPTTADTGAPTTEGTPTPGCSADGTETPASAKELPDRVAEKRAAIVAAAASCDLARLEGLAAGDFRTSFGGGGVENLALWEESGEGRLDTLLELFGTTPGLIEIETGETFYVWPAAATYASWEDVPDDLVAELDSVIRPGDLEEFAAFGSYLSWRTGIDSNGNWIYFIAGD